MSLACVALALSSRSSGAAQRYEHPKAVVVAFVQGNCLSVRRDDNPKSVMRALLKSSTRILAYWRIEYQLLYTNDRMQEFYPFEIAVDNVLRMQILKAKCNITDLGQKDQTRH